PGNGGGGRPTFPQSGSILARMEIGGTLPAYGVQRNGTLALGAPRAIKIGAQPFAPRLGLYIPEMGQLHTGSAHNINQSKPDTDVGTTGNTSIAVSVGRSLTLQQRNRAILVDYRAKPTGTKIATVAPLVAVPADPRPAVDLPLRFENILLDAGSKIMADPKA